MSCSAKIHPPRLPLTITGTAAQWETKKGEGGIRNAFHRLGLPTSRCLYKINARNLCPPPRRWATGGRCFGKPWCTGLQVIYKQRE